MGRKRLKIKKISDFKTRLITFDKRKRGLLKKAMELSILCGHEILVSYLEDDGTYIIYHTSGDYLKYAQKYMLNEEITRLSKSDEDYDHLENSSSESEEINKPVVKRKRIRSKSKKYVECATAINKDKAIRQHTSEIETINSQSNLKSMITHQKSETSSSDVHINSTRGLLLFKLMKEDNPDTKNLQANVRCSLPLNYPDSIPIKKAEELHTNYLYHNKANLRLIAAKDCSSITHFKKKLFSTSKSKTTTANECIDNS